VEIAAAVLLYALWARSKGSGTQQAEPPPSDDKPKEEATPAGSSSVPWGSLVGAGLGTAGTVAAAVISAAAGGGGTVAAAGGATAATGAGATAAGASGSGAASAAGGGTTAGATAGGSAAVAASAAGEISLGAGLGIFAIWVVVVVALTLVLQFAGPVVRELDRRRKYGAAGLASWVRFTADQFATVGMLAVLNQALGPLDSNNKRPYGSLVQEAAPSSDLPPEAPTQVPVVGGAFGALLGAAGATSYALSKGRPERMAYDLWISDIQGISDRALLRDVYRGLQQLGLYMAETDNLIRWTYFLRFSTNETYAQLEKRLSDAGLALSPDLFTEAVQGYWRNRQYTPWGDAAPVDPLQGSAQAERALDYIFGAKKAQVVAGFRLWGAANAWKWLQTNYDLLSRRDPYLYAFQAAGLSVKKQDQDGNVVWCFPAAPNFIMANGVVIDLTIPEPPPPVPQ
jgi:hypothetical protein